MPTIGHIDYVEGKVQTVSGRILSVGSYINAKEDKDARTINLDAGETIVISRYKSIILWPLYDVVRLVGPQQWVFIDISNKKPDRSRFGSGGSGGGGGGGGGGVPEQCSALEEYNDLDTIAALTEQSQDLENLLPQLVQTQVRALQEILIGIDDGVVREQIEKLQQIVHGLRSGEDRIALQKQLGELQMRPKQNP